MMRFVTISLMGCVCCVLSSCSSQSEDELMPPKAIPEATIQFSSPLPDSAYRIGDPIAIIATAISTENIHGYDLSIRQPDAPTSMYFIHIHNHNDTLYIHEKWKAAVTAPSTLEAEITLYLDHEGHTKNEKVGFHVQ